MIGFVVTFVFPFIVFPYGKFCFQLDISSIPTLTNIYISIIIPSLHTKNSARRHTIPMKLLWHFADMPTLFGKSWRSIVPLAFCTMRIFVIPRVRSVVCYQLCCTAIPCMCTGIASIYIYFSPQTH